MAVQGLANPSPLPICTNDRKVQIMTLFKNDLYRNLAFGFLLGAVGVALVNPAIMTAIV